MPALRVDPLPQLAISVSEPLGYFVRRGLLGEDAGPVEALWASPGARAILARQQADGSFRYPGGRREGQSFTNYDLLETFRQLRLMVWVFGMHSGCGALRAAAEYVLSWQTPTGDVRGILGNQLMPYYHGALLGLLIRAGFADDPRVKRGLQWLLETRQDDGGWVIPAQTLPASAKTEALWRGEPLSALAAHRALCRSAEAIGAAELLKDRAFRADRYGDRKGVEYWTKFQYPFWWPNILTLLTALSEMGYPASDPTVGAGIQWFVEHQEADGLWPTGYGHGPRAQEERRWVALAVLRLFRHWHGPLSAR